MLLPSKKENNIIDVYLENPRNRFIISEKSYIQQNVPLVREQLKNIVSCISETLDASDFSHIHFEPSDFVWTATLIRSTFDDEFNKDIKIMIIISEDISPQITKDNPKNYFTIKALLTLGCNRPHIEDAELLRAQTHFHNIIKKLKTTVIRCQFPVSPEGISGKTFRQCYQLNAKLNEGGFAIVCRGTHRATQIPVAVKCIERKSLSLDQENSVYEEIYMISSLHQHPNIVSLMEVFEEENYFYLVMELMEGGDLFDRVIKLKKYSERDGRIICKALLEAVKYCHDGKVAHLSITPKNVLLPSLDNDLQVKLSGFGHAQRITDDYNTSLTKRSGAPLYVAPEILIGGSLDERADTWSVGVILYLLLGGQLPFTGNNFIDLGKCIVIGEYEFPGTRWNLVSKEAKDLIRHLLATDAGDRYSVQEALDADWFSMDLSNVTRRGVSVTGLPPHPSHAVP